MWLLGSSVSSLARVYSYLHTPRSIGHACLVIKETRSSVNLESIVNGMRAEKVLILIRHPYSVIASHVAGSNAGVMSGYGQEQRAEWYKNRQGAQYLQDNGIGKNDIEEMPEIEFQAINWLLQNLDYLDIAKQRENTVVLAYEDFLKDPSGQTARLMSFLELDPTEQVEKFIAESTVDTNVSVLKKDASNSFYSVYRDKSFNPEKWKKILSAEDLTVIDRHCQSLLQNIALFDQKDYAI